MFNADNLIDYLLTCVIENCENKDLAVEAKAPEGDIVAFCGACGNEITEIELAE